MKNSLEKGERKYAARASAYTKVPNYRGDEEYLKWHKIWLEIPAWRTTKRQINPPASEKQSSKQSSERKLIT